MKKLVVLYLLMSDTIYARARVCVCVCECVNFHIIYVNKCSYPFYSSNYAFLCNYVHFIYSYENKTKSDKLNF